MSKTKVIKELSKENTVLAMKIEELENALNEKNFKLGELEEQVDNLPPADHNMTLELIYQFSKLRFELIETIKDLTEREMNIESFLKGLRHRHPKVKNYIDQKLIDNEKLNLQYGGMRKYEGIKGIYDEGGKRCLIAS